MHNNWCKDNANERNESLLSNCRVQLILCKDTHILLKSLYLVFGRHYRYSVSINKNNSYSIHTSLYLRSFAILAWSLARLRLEKADKVLRIFKAEALADLRNAEGFIHK